MVLRFDDFAAGFLAGSVSRTLTAPADRVKTEMQIQTGARQSVLTVCRRVRAAQGVKGFFQGNLTNCIKVAPQSALFFALSDYFRKVLPTESDSRGLQPGLRSFCAGTLAGVASQLIIYPLEPIKTCLTIAPHGRYDGILDCGRQLVREGGTRALFRGVAPTLAGCVPYAGTQLLAYDTLQKTCKGFGTHTRLPTITSFCCGLASSSLAMIVSYPLMVVRTRLQVQGASQYTGPADCLRKTVEHEGLRGLLRGIGPNLAKAAPAAAVNFALYEFLRDSIGGFWRC
mmetsp:Transcript_105458/g.264029  ORF Transcript_105458/g.264029 Transcript_105458/m.264029 type:complete len:285 (-) Transcript_105458:230-1084(-)